MANQSLAVVEAALRARKLDRTLTSALPGRPSAETAAATGLARLDEVLRGGLPRGQLSEVVGARSSGCTALLLQTLAAATRRGEVAALVDTCDRLEVASAVSANVDLDRFFWIRGHDVVLRAPGLGPRTVPDRAVERALKALNLVLQAGGFGVVAIDLADVPASALRAIPFTTWLRVQRTIEGSETACVIAGPQPLGRSAGGLTLMLDARPRYSGLAPGAWLSGFDLAVRVVSPRRHMDDEIRLDAAVR